MIEWKIGNGDVRSFSNFVIMLLNTFVVSMGAFETSLRTPMAFSQGVRNKQHTEKYRTRTSGSSLGVVMRTSSTFTCPTPQ
jgi:hypothetical protein